MPLAVEDIARITHEANRALQLAQADPTIPVAPPWDDFPYAEQLPVIEGVGHALNGASPRQLHESWRYAKERDGWTYGPVKDSAAKLHPCLVPYDDLPESQQVKDELFSVVVGALRVSLA
jgi:hypothetical protein